MDEATAYFCVIIVFASDLLYHYLIFNLIIIINFKVYKILITIVTILIKIIRIKNTYIYIYINVNYY